MKGGGSSKSEFADSKDLPDLKAAFFYILRKSNGTKRNSLKFYNNYTKSTPCFLHDRREKKSHCNEGFAKFRKK